MASTTFDEELARVLANIRSGGAGVETWVNPILSIQARTPEEEEQKTGMLATIGELLHEPKKRVDIAMNYYANKPLRDRVLAGGEPVPTGVLAKEAYIGPPEIHQTPAEQHLRAAGRGVMERWIDVSTDPLMAAIPPAMKVLPAGARVAAALGFTAAMAKDAIHQADRTYQSYKREGWSPTTSEEAAKTAFDVGMLGTMVPGFIPRRGRGAPPVAPSATETALVPRPPIIARPIPGRRGGVRAWLPPEEPGLPPGPGPEPPPPPTTPGRPRLREVNAPEAPERLADDALLGQITAIRNAIQASLEGGNIDRAQELRRHYERLRDVYRTRRYAPEVRVGRAGDLMQLRDQLRAELGQGPGMERQLEIREALSVLDAEIDLARGATAPGAPPEAAPTGVPPAPPPEPGVAPEPPPPGPVASRMPQVAPEALAAGLPPPTPEAAVLEAEAAARPGVQELFERGRAEAAGLQAPERAPLATVLEGGQPAGAARRAMEPEVIQPAPPPAAAPGAVPLPGMPGGPPLDIQLAPAGQPRLVPRGPVLPAPTVAAEPEIAAAATKLPSPAETLPLGTKLPSPEETLPPGAKMRIAEAPPAPAEGEQVDLAAVAREAAEPPAVPEAPAGPVSYAMETFPRPTRGLSSEQARKKSQAAQIRWIDYDGKPMYITPHLTARGPVALQGPRDVASPGTGPAVRKLAEALTQPARVVGWQRGADPKNQPVWFEAPGKGKRSKPMYAAVDGDYFRTLNRLAKDNPGAEWRMGAQTRGNPAVGLFDKDGGLLGIVAPLNEKGPPPPIEAAPPAEPEVPPRMRAAARQLEAELAGEPVPKGRPPAPTAAEEPVALPAAVPAAAPEGAPAPPEEVQTAPPSEAPPVVAPAAPAPAVAEPPAPAADIATLEAERAALREQRAQQLADENARLRDELEEARATEGEGVGPAPPEILPRPGEEAAGGGEIRGVPARAGGRVGEGLSAAGGIGPEPYPGGRGGEGRGVPESRAVPVSERSVGTDAPTGVPLEELRADGAARVVEPLPIEPAQKRESRMFAWVPGKLEVTETRSLRQKATDNLGALRLLKGLEAEDRAPSAPEAEALAKYIGWGGMPRIFKDYDYGAESDYWQEQHKALLELLTPEEYEAAKASVTNAHFTREEVIRGIWDGISALGGDRMMRVLEPSMGVGNFLSSLPRNLRPAHFTGVELDPVTGRIAKKLFPGANIHVAGFESTPIPDNYFDLAISNVPFGNYSVADPRFRDEPFLTKRIHNYFFAKALDKVRPGGLVAFITSHYTMDAKDAAFREYIAGRAWLVGAVRLPRSTFQRNANTSVTTDVVLLQKKIEGQDRPEWAAADSWINTETVPMRGKYDQPVEPRINSYFRENPSQVLGELAVGDGTGGPDELTVSGDFEATRFKDALRRLGAPDILSKPVAAVQAAPIATAEELRRMKPGNLSVREGKLWRLDPDGSYADTDLPRSAVAVANSWIPIRDAARDVIGIQLERGTDAELAAAQKKLNKTYDAFVRKHGPLHGKAAAAFVDDPDFPLTLALEDWRPPQYLREGRKRRLVAEGKATKRDIFSKRTVSGYEPPTSADTTAAAYGIALAERGRIDVERMAALLKTTPSDALSRVLAEGIAYEDPSNGGRLEPAEEYLSGNVVEKLEQARAAVEHEPERFKQNVAALEAVQPAPLTPAEVTVQLGVSWVPADIYAQFAATELGGQSTYRPSDVQVRHSEGLGIFKIDWDHRLTYSAAAAWTYGTADLNALELFDAGMNLRTPTVYRGSGTDRHIDEDATALARDKLDQIKERWQSWVFSDPDRATKLVDLYNRQFNNQRLRTPSGAHLVFPGMNRAVLRGGDLEPHQKNDVWRILTQANTLVAEPVGSGKTWTLAAALMEARRTGVVKKPVLAVPSSVFGQWGEEWRRLYPQAKLLIVQPDQLRGKARAETMSRIATEEWDGVLVSHEALKSLPVSAKAVEAVVREEIALLDQTLRDLADEMESDESIEDFTARATAPGRRRARMSRSDTKLVKEIEKQKQSLKAKLKGLYEEAKRDKTIAFDELGVDMLLVDESHYFNNLFFPTKLGRVKGISNENAARAFDLYIKTRTLQRQTGGRGIVFATATPVRNTLAEMYTLFRYLAPEFLKERGLRHFDNWVRAFATAKVSLGIKPTGTGYRPETRFSQFVNVPELLTAFRNFAAVLTAEDLKLPTPDIAVNSKGERKPNFVDIEPSREVRAYVKTLEVRAEKLKGKGKAVKGEDNMLVVTGDGRKAAIDLALVRGAAEPAAGQKLDTVRQKVYDLWKRTESKRGVQAVFLDLSTPDSQPFSAYRWLRDRWIAMGVPANEIDFAHNYTPKTKGDLYAKLNASQVRIVLGSSKKLGVGANFQNNVIALHHVDVPWTPDGLEQRNGRGIRQGNVNPEVEIHNYVTKGTFDAYMWQTIATKAGFIGQVMTGKAAARTMEDVSLTYLTAQEALAATSENPLVVKKIQLEADIRKFERLQGAYQRELYDLGARRADWERQITFNTDKARDILDAVRQLKAEHTLELFEKPSQNPLADASKTFEKRNEEAGDAIKALVEGITPGPGTYFIGRYRGFPIWVRRAQMKDAVFTDVRLPTPSTVAGLTEHAIAMGTPWGPQYTGSGLGLLQSMDAQAPTEAQAQEHAARAVAKKNELAKLKTPEFRYATELERIKTELAAVNEDLKTQKDDEVAAEMEPTTDEDEGGEPAEDADYEAGETGAAEEESIELDEGPPVDLGGGAGGAGAPPGPPRPPRPPGDDGDATPDGLPGDGPQPGEAGWDRRVREAKARNRKRARGGQANAGIDPMHMADIAIEGADLVARGFRRFAGWSREMLRTLGSLVPGLKGMLRGLWNWIRQMFDKSGRGPTPGSTGPTRPRPGFEEYREAYQQATAGQRGAERRRYPYEEREIPPEEVRAAAEEGARVGAEPPPEYGKPPKADVNFDRIGGEPDIREWQARVVESLKPRWGKIRSFRSWAEARESAVRAGLSEQDFIQLVKERGAVTDIEIEAGRMMREQGAQSAFAKLERLKELQERLRGETDPVRRTEREQEVLEADREYRDALARYVAVTSATVEAASELGRALNIHRKMAEAITPEESFFRNLLRKHPGMSEQMQAELADAVMNRDAAKIRELARKLYKPGPLDYATEWFVNSLLSGLTTLEVNVLGNLSWEALFRTPERAVAAGVEAAGARQWVERLFGREAAKRERFGREFEEALRSHIETRFGMLRSLKYAWEFVLNEPPTTGAKGEFRPPAFTGFIGKVIRTPSRMMYALDLGSRWAAMEAEASVQAVRRAIMESREAGGWTRDQVTRRMRELQEGYRHWSELEARRQSGEVLAKEEYQFLAKNPMYGRWQGAIRQAGAKATFTDNVDRFSGALLQMREAHPWLTFFLPFIKTPSRILAAALERSPWGAYDTFRKAKAGELTGGELTDAMARVVYGNMIGASLYLLARQGLITGSGPADPRERSTLMKTGWQPYAAKIGDTYVSLARLEPFGTHLGWAADLAEARDVRGAGELYDKLIQGISLNIVNKTYLQGAIGLAEAIGDPERYGAAFGRKTLGAFVPNLLAQAARAIDPTVRETDTITGTLMSRVPVLSMALPPRRAGTGEPIVREEHPLSLWLNPFRYAKEKGPEANLERIFLDVGYIPSNAPKTLTIPRTGGRKVALTSDERQLYADFKERATRFARRLAQNEQFNELEASQQEELLKRIYRYAHDGAHRAMMASVVRRAGSVEWVK